ncbi:hypothetical protein L486_07832 [Kwoniella mangroviensis CBS 10435]|uniref:BTB domain-containing protein n=1 Tax=Kwoniella mangroviensis CBS 10435 TaxID=1331196 RepID=A0A1B9IG97_9TREE|nr:hypothetical protein L486_07832 [Kwoniella mangroviensis CBS 10435]
MSFTEAPSTREQPATKAASGGENNSSALNAEYQAEDTDIILRSSDGLDFKVHKWALMGSSKVFHGMLTVGNNEIGATIELMDEKIEHSRNIKSFLDLAYSKSMIKFALNGDDRNPSSDLIDFLLKYEATYPLLWLKAALKAFIAYNDIDPLDMFIVGPQLDSIDICIAAIRCESNIDWADGQVGIYCTCPLPRHGHLEFSG